MISFDQWEKDCMNSIREYCTESFFETIGREPNEEELKELIGVESEERYQKMCGY